MIAAISAAGTNVTRSATLEEAGVEVAAEVARLCIELAELADVGRTEEPDIVGEEVIDGETVDADTMEESVALAAVLQGPF